MYNIAHWTIRCLYVIRAICVIFFIMYVYMSVFFFQIIGVLSFPSLAVLLTSHHHDGKNKQKTDTKTPLLQ